MVFCEESDLWARYWENNVFCSCCRARVLSQNARSEERRWTWETKKKLKMEKFSERGCVGRLCPLWPPARSAGTSVGGCQGTHLGARAQDGKSEGGNVGCGSVNPRDPSSERVGNSGGPGRGRGNKLGEGNGLKRQRLALLGANTRAHRAFFATPCRNSRRPPHRSLEYLYPRDVLHPSCTYASPPRPNVPLPSSPSPD
jgi:hypothetical protein